jgi:hypothetical protein
VTAGDDDTSLFLAGRNINAYYFFHLFANLAFWLPIYAIFFLHHGLTYSGILILYAVNTALQSLLELPSGVLADRWGRKPVLMLGALLQAAGYFLVAAGSEAILYGVGMACLGSALAFLSGCDSAFIYDTLKIAGRENEFKQVEGRAYMYNLIGWGAGGLLGGLLAEKNLALPFILSGIASVLAFFVVGTTTEPPRKFSHLAPSGRFKAALTRIRQNADMRNIIMFYALIIGVLLVSHKFSQPYLEAAGIDLKLFGVIYFGWLAFAAVAARYTETIGRVLGGGLYLLSLPLLTGVMLLYMGFWQNVTGAFIAFTGQYAWGSLRPQMAGLVNRDAPSDVRATILSVAGFGSSLVYIVLSPAAGFVADRLGFPSALVYLGIGIIILGFLMWLPLRKVDLGNRRQ